jgi:DNA-binding NarL/FixJ family response regulator
MPFEKPISVVIVDDHPVVRDGLSAMISAEADIEVVAETGSGKGALSVIPQFAPQVAVVDLLLPDLHGSEVIARLAPTLPNTAFLVLTTLAGDEEIRRAIEAGARGYLFKDMARKELVDAIRQVAHGRRYIPAEVGSKLAENLPRPDLTEREVEVLRLLASGLRNKEIAHQLGIAETTTNAHVKSILEKLNAGHRTQAVTTALKRGIIHL